MTKFSKFLAVCGCCCGLALVGCQSTRHVDATGAACGGCKDACCKNKTVDVQASDCAGKDCAGKCTKSSTVDVQATECSAKSSCSGGSCHK